jgi:hypothetical protein
MDKGLTVPKLVLINQLKIPQMPPNLSVQVDKKYGITGCGVFKGGIQN